MTAPRSWEIALAYPTPPLSLNDRDVWQVRARKARLLRDRVRAMTAHLQIPRLEAVHIDMLWIPKDRRVRDADNLVATLKPGIDGTRDYPARYRTVGGVRVLVEPAYRGVIADDDPTHLTWSRPVIGEPDRNVTDRLIFTLTERTPDRG